MSARIALVDYGAGNLASVRKAFVACGAEVFAPEGPGALGTADAIVVPGVGHFDRTRVLDEAWRDAVWAALDQGRALFGICLGMQWLFEGSDEAPGCAGLGILAGRCELLRPGARAVAPRSPQGRAVGEGAAGETSGAGLKVPHVGWNSLEPVRASVLLAGIAPGAQAYFTHSYAAPVTTACVAKTSHGERFASVVEEGRVFGVQLHPEKSGEVGLKMLRNFLSQVKRGHGA